jgi:hypothetical protein
MEAGERVSILRRNKMAKDKKPTVSVACVIIKCSVHGEQKVPLDDVRLSTSVTPCELCGEHGTTKAEIRCPVEGCKAQETVELDSW